VNLLERRSSLEVLEQCAQDLHAGEGRIALVGGEAGLGKTSLVEQFASVYSRRGRVFWGRCDPLHTPAPLAPFYDVAEQIGDRARAFLEERAGSGHIAPRLVEELQRAAPAVVVLEDLPLG